MRALGLALCLLLSAPAWGAAPASEAARITERAARVTISRDHLGIAHIRAASDADAVFGMAFAQAEDDFNRVETNYLTSLGRRAEAEGDKALWQDVRQRLWIDEADLRRRYAAAAPWLKALLEGWADGLNFYLATHPKVTPRVLTRFEPWMALSFSEGSIGGDIEYVDLAALRTFIEHGAATARVAKPHEEPQGSNGIAIAPSRSISGRPLLLINPHTSFFFRDVVQVTSDEGLNVYGAVTWGQPFVYQGFNQHAAWMHTSSGLDNRDEYAETVARRGGGMAYRHGKKWRPIETRAIALRVRQTDGSLTTRSVTTFRTHHGPIVRAEGGKWIAFAILDDPVRALEQSFLRTKASNLKEWMAVGARHANSSNNMLFADASGTIAYLHPQFVPLRDDHFDYRGPVDGSDPRADWTGLTPISALPMVVNPASGFVYNSNDAPWSAAGRATLKASAFPRYMDQWGANARTEHALALLSGTRKFSAAGLIAAAYDPALPGFERILPGLLRAYDGLGRADPRRRTLAAPIALLRKWDRRWGKDSEAQSLAIHWGETLWREVMGKDKPSNGAEVAYSRMVAAAPVRQLAALDSAIGKMRGLYGGWRVAWGSINRFQRNDGRILQAFDDRKPSLAVGFPSADWGTLASFGARTYPGAKRRYGTSGNSFVAVVELGPDGPRAFAVTAGGVNGDPASPHFADQAQDYADGRLSPVPFAKAEVDAATRERYHPGEPRIAQRH
ncbi:MAG: penicillin acylase family protein [Sphingomonas bacterium]|nr:penicillin acylase family protein [Sphingomonas bacterium]